MKNLIFGIPIFFVSIVIIISGFIDLADENNFTLFIIKFLIGGLFMALAFTLIEPSPYTREKKEY